MPQPLVDRWIRYHVERCKASDPLYPAWVEVDELLRRDSEAGWRLTLELVMAAPDNQVLANVAAGPLEYLLTREPERFVDRVELEARRDLKFRRCLTGVWGLSASLRDRVAKFTFTVADPL
jgi:hypothetical protein